MASARSVLLVVALVACLGAAHAFPANLLTGISDKVKSVGAGVLDAVNNFVDTILPDEYPAGQKFNYIRGVEGKDSRSPCPALNTLANHGYLNRDGRGITRQQLIQALVKRMGVSSPAANVLALGAFPKLTVDGKLDLDNLKTHNVIEHDASLTRVDAALSNNHQRIFNATRFQKLLTFSKDGKSLTLEDLARARTYFNQDSEKNNPQYTWNTQLSFNAKGEAIALTNVLGRNNAISIEYAKSFFEQEKFPDDWKTPSPEIGLVKILRLVFEFNNMLKAAGGGKYV